MTNQFATEASIAGLDAAADLDLDAYRVHLQPLTPDQRDRLYQMTLGVKWPHRIEDLDLTILVGRGLIGIDEIGRPLCTAMAFPMGDDFATIGMMTTTPRLQMMGAGRWLLQAMLKECQGRDLRLNATRAGFALYQEAGFIPVVPVKQMQGIARAVETPPDVSGLVIRALTDDDHSAIFALDKHAYGACRQHLLTRLLGAGSGTIALRDGQAVGFALRRRFGKGVVIGPVVACDDASAMQLIAPLIHQAEGQFTRMDTPVESAALRSFLDAAGLRYFDTVTEMRIGPHRRATTGPVTYGLAAHSFG
ncbi:MAG: GNAT family N-acetyltransferase [Rhodobacteraceae bacterium]|nr:GNAT family N-acetyltransferase [Paracoccaceae bacterium]